MKTILIVDDRSTIAKAMRRFLVGAGYDVDTLHESATFFDGSVPAFEPDLLMLDINMPCFDGFYSGNGPKDKHLFAGQNPDVLHKNI
jgi:DNA-binding response OmpR family regulator